MLNRMLWELTNMRGVTVAILSLNNEQRINAFIRCVGLDHYFSAVWGHQSLRGQSKGRFLQIARGGSFVVFADDTGRNLASVKSHVWSACTMLVRNQRGEKEGLSQWHCNSLCSLVQYSLADNSRKATYDKPFYVSKNTGHCYNAGGIAIVEQYTGNGYDRVSP
jgi:hypothetical protein